MAADVTLTSAKMPAEETSQMPPAADQPHDDRVSAVHTETPSPTPSADAAPGGDHSGSNPAEEGESGSGEGASAEAGSGEAGSGEGLLGSEPHRRRRRRRRRPPREFITPQPSGAAGALSHDAAADEAGPSTDRSGEYAASGGAANSDDETGVRGDAAMAPGTAAPGAVPREGMPGDRPHRRRRRRRRPPPGAIGATPAPGALGSALPPVDASAGADSDSGVAAPEESAAGEGDGAPGSSQWPRVYLRRPVRGRRQLSRPPGLQAGLVASLPVAGETQPGDAPSGGGASTPRAEGEFRRPRRHRRPLPRTGEAAPAGEGQSLGGTPWDTERQPRRGGMRGPRPGGDRAYNRQTQRPGEPPGPSGPGREIGTGVAGQRSRDR